MNSTPLTPDWLDGKFIDRNGTEHRIKILSDRTVFENIKNPIASYFVYHPKPAALDAGRDSQIWNHGFSCGLSNYPDSEERKQRFLAHLPDIHVGDIGEAKEGGFADYAKKVMSGGQTGENYRDQISTLQSRIAELEAWKESAISVMPDYQAIGKEIGVKLGASVRDKILPAIQAYKQRISTLEAEREKAAGESFEAGIKRQAFDNYPTQAWSVIPPDKSTYLSSLKKERE